MPCPGSEQVRPLSPDSPAPWLSSPNQRWSRKPGGVRSDWGTRKSRLHRQALTTARSAEGHGGRRTLLFMFV